jgi:hypothetical protein
MPDAVSQPSATIAKINTPNQKEGAIFMTRGGGLVGTYLASAVAHAWHTGEKGTGRLTAAGLAKEEVHAAYAGLLGSAMGTATPQAS